MIWQTTTPTPQTTPHNIQEIFIQLKNRVLEAMPGLITGLLLFFIFWLAAAIGAKIIAAAAKRAKADASMALLVSRVYYYTVLIFGLFVALSATGLNINGLVAGLGLTGFALGFALKDVLANLLSGIMLLLYRPFQIGDNITMGDHTGTILTIRMRDTILLSNEGKTIIIPNSKLITEVVVNNTNATKTIQPKEPTKTEIKPKEEDSLKLEIPSEAKQEGS